MENKKQELTGFRRWWYDITHVRKNYKKVQASPYASLVFALKVRKVIIGLLIPYLIYMCVKMVLDYSARGFMATFGRAVMIGVFAFLIFKIYSTIPAAKKQIEYYRKYPHTINYCPANTKEEINDILNKIKQNQEKGGKNDFQRKETTSRSSKTKKDRRSSSTRSSSS